MATLSIGQKGRRVLNFLNGAAKPRAASLMARYGFGQEAYDNGWRLLKAVSGEHLDVGPVADTPAYTAALLGLDEWENLWYPIISAVLVNRHPAVQAWLFRNLSQQTGPAVTLSVRTLVDRFDLLKKRDASLPDDVAAEAPAAMEILAARGFTAGRLEQARDLLKEVGQLESVDLPDPEEIRAAQAKAEQELWAWYLEWSTIAQQAISDGRVLRSLGFRSGSSASSTEPLDEVEEDEDEAPDDLLVA